MMQVGIPIDFVLFALTLIGVALFHRYTLHVALTGAATIAPTIMCIARGLQLGQAADRGAPGGRSGFAAGWIVLSLYGANGAARSILLIGEIHE